MSFWNEETIARLRALWAEGVETAEIGRRMGISKNAVAGKVHRLNLPKRPSPIRRDGAPKVVQIPTRAKETLGVLAGEEINVSPATEAVLEVALPATPPLPPVVASGGPREVTVVGGASHRATHFPCCQWPIGEPGTESFRFCDAEAVPRRPYCEEHTALAYVRPKAVNMAAD